MLSNEEAVQVVATATSRATAARSLVESAVRVWRLKYPTSKVDDCAVVVLYLDVNSDISTESSEVDNVGVLLSSPQTSLQSRQDAGTRDEENRRTDSSILKAPKDDVQEIGEIVDVKETNEPGLNESKRHRSLADWLDADESEEWSALEGVTRVNSILNLPRFADGTDRSVGTSKKNL